MESSTLVIADARYPAMLANIRTPPALLYYKGDIGLLSGECVSIVGSRTMTSYGKQVTRLLVPSLVRSRLTVVSGLAYGIDAEAHRIALHAGGRCVVVLGSGLNRIYPTRNEPLLRQILEAGGCVITEYESDTEPYAGNFPARNRIVAGLSRATVVIEAGDKSGTLITARCALDSGRDVYAVPGDITRKGSRGVTRLLTQGATPALEAADILASYAGLPFISVPTDLRPALTGAMATIYSLVSHGTHEPDALLQASGYGVAQLQSILSVLEMDGYLYRNGTQWQRTS